MEVTKDENNKNSEKISEDNAQTSELKEEAVKNIEANTEKSKKTENHGVSKLENRDKQRGKRMFGVLMSTLNKFQNESKNKTNGELKREEIETKLLERLQREKEELEKQKEEERLLRLQRIEEAKQKKLNMEREIINTLQEGYDNSQKKFLLTKTEPKLFFKIKKVDPGMEELLQDYKVSLDKE